MARRTVEDYRAPLFIAWQLTNRCQARCLACCEESGPALGWADELSAGQAISLARRIANAGVPYVAFGGGEPLGVPHAWDLFEALASAGTAIKLETDGRFIDDAAADRLAALPVQCVQISVDGASAATHERVRPGGDFQAAVSAIDRLARRGRPAQLVFVPTRHNLGEMKAVYDLAAGLGCEAFVTGPLMRLGRAARDWERLAPSQADWSDAVAELRAHAEARPRDMALSIYPWDIMTELTTRLASPQAMLLVVPNGLVKLLNALPFAVADLRRDSLAVAWNAYRSAWRSGAVRTFIERCASDPRLLLHANETWSLDRVPIAIAPI